MKLWGNVLGMKRMKTNEFGHMFGHYCPDMLISLHSLYTKNISSKFRQRYILGPKWPNLGLNDGHARARMGEHVTTLTSLHSFNTKNISTKFHRNLMKQIQDILENVHFRPNQPTAPPTFAIFASHFCISRNTYRRKILLYSIQNRKKSFFWHMDMLNP